jgi:segregation and condensation protein A
MFDFASPTVRLDGFEGPVDLLLYLVQQREVNLLEILLQEITNQWSHQSLDESAEFLIPMASLLLLKSQALLPVPAAKEEEEPDPRFDMIQSVADYCRFREAAKGLVSLESEQLDRFSRGVAEELPPMEKPAGLHHLSLGDLATLLSDILQRASEREPVIILDEEWKASDRMEFIRRSLNHRSALPFSEIFDESHSKGRLIATFLALLELMKLGEVAVISDGTIQIVPRRAHDN